MGLKKHIILIFGIISFVFPLEVFGAGIVINEVMFDPAGTDTGLEWVEIYNSGEMSENIAGWQLYPDGIGYFSFPNLFTLEPKKFIAVYLRTSGQDSSIKRYYPDASSNMGNTSGSIALFSGEPRGKDTIKDFVQWGKAGETWESAASDAGIWEKGSLIDTVLFSEGEVLARKTEGKGKDAWAISTLATPGVPNQISSNPSPASLPSFLPLSSGQSSSNPTSPAPVPPLSPSIKVNAGEDKTVSVGSLAEFSGNAWGLKEEPLQNARFWWNFGDGEADEGKNVSHIFHYLGKYMVGLHVSSGDASASDYVLVEVSPNHVVIREVIKGETGFIRLENSALETADIGGWILEDSEGEKFSVPPKTKINSQSQIVLANTATGILENANVSFLILRYPNSEIATRYEIDTHPVKAPEMETSHSAAGDSKKMVSAEARVSLALQELQEAEDATVENQKAGPSQNEILAEETGRVSKEANKPQGEARNSSPDAVQNEPDSTTFFGADAATYFLMALGVSFLGAVSFILWKVLL